MFIILYNLLTFIIWLILLFKVTPISSFRELITKLIKM